jgi:hypothetical protein
MACLVTLLFKWSPTISAKYQIQPWHIIPDNIYVELLSIHFDVLKSA